jgi:hypothetical protein
LNRSLPSTDQREHHEKNYHIINSRFDGDGWSRDGSRADAGRITGTEQKTGATGKKTARGKARDDKGAEDEHFGRKRVVDRDRIAGDDAGDDASDDTEDGQKVEPKEPVGGRSKRECGKNASRYRNA